MSRPISFTGAEAQSFLLRPLADTSTEELSALLAGGAKPIENWKVGLEIELIPHDALTHSTVEHARLAALFETLAAHGGWELEREPSGPIIGLRRNGELVSLEPGGQVEYASRPYRILSDLQRALTEFADSLGQAATRQGIRFWAMGRHPYATAQTMPKMPKARYDLMRAYLPLRGSRGLDMMHLSASVQCALDFSDEKNLVDKIRTAARISPFLSALCASSPFASGRPHGLKTDRYDIWLHTDDPRSGLWPEMVDAEGLTFQRYVEHALRTPAMLFIRDGQYRMAEPKPYAAFAETGFEDTTVTVADFLDHLTTMFPEIRPKSYVELRGADCAPPAQAVAIAGVWRGLLDDENLRQEVEDRLQPMDYSALRELQPKVARLGLEADSPVGRVSEIARWLTASAYAGMKSAAPDCAECLVPLVERGQSRRSLADDLLEQAEKTSLAQALDLVTLPGPDDP